MLEHTGWCLVGNAVCVGHTVLCDTCWLCCAAWLGPQNARACSDALMVRQLLGASGDKDFLSSILVPCAAAGCLAVVIRVYGSAHLFIVAFLVTL